MKWIRYFDGRLYQDSIFNLDFCKKIALGIPDRDGNNSIYAVMNTDEIHHIANKLSEKEAKTILSSIEEFISSDKNILEIKIRDVIDV